MLQPLIFSGVAVNDWIRLLTSVSDERTAVGGSLHDLQLQSFRIQGSGRQFVCLSHSSMLFIHLLVYSNPSMELALVNVCLQYERDIDLVSGSFQPRDDRERFGKKKNLCCHIL